jgi:NADPH2:quinone reductase
VLEIGPGVDGFESGQPVAALLNDFGRGKRAGGYAEVAISHGTMTSALPEGADLARIAAVLVNGVTAWIALHDLARLGVHDDVLILGASGGLGGTAGRLAAIHPAHRVIGVAGSSAKQLSGTAMWTGVLSASEFDAGIREITAGRGVDIVIDPVGGELRTRAYERLAPFGRLVVLGNASGRDAAFSGDSAWLGTRQVLGLSLGGVAHLMPRQVSAALSAVIDLAHRDVLREPAPAILPLDRVAEVHRALEGRTAPAKTVLAVR